MSRAVVGSLQCSLVCLVLRGNETVAKSWTGSGYLRRSPWQCYAHGHEKSKKPEQISIRTFS